MPLLRDLHVGLSALALDPRTVVIEPPPSDTVHPIPRSCVDTGFIAEWALYMGRLLAYQDEFIPTGYCIGIACAFGFAGGPCDTYADAGARAFPIVDETFNEGNVLRSPSEYRVPRNVASATIRKDDVLAHWAAIPNALDLEEPDRDSHRKLRFPHSHWTLDLNWDTIDPRLIGDLADHAQLETPVLKFVLLHGELPPVRQSVSTAQLETSLSNGDRSD